MRYSREQQKLIATFYSNIAVAWFSSGVITVYLTKSVTLKEFALSLTALMFTLYFHMLSLKVGKEI